MTSLLKGVNQNGKNKTEHAKDYDEDYIPEVEDELPEDEWEIGSN